MNTKEPTQQDIETQDAEIDGTETEPQKNYRGKSSLKRLKDRLKSLDKIASDPKVKAAKQADVALEASSIEKLLFQTEREDKADKNLVELATVTAQASSQQEEIARLNALNAELRARAAQPVAPERIPDSVLQEQVQTLEALLTSVATLARSVDVESRTRHAVSLVLKYDKRAQTVLTDMGVDYSSVVVNLQRSKTELLSLLQQAQREGSSTPLLRAVLFVRDGVTATIGKQQPRFVNEFSNEYDRL
jgi:hypothetical protein